MIQVLVTVDAPEDTSPVDVQYGVGDTLGQDPAFQLNGWKIVNVELA